MVLLYILAVIYIIVGLVYALYVLFNGIDPVTSFPINFLLGPAVLAYNYYKFVVKKKIPRAQ